MGNSTQFVSISTSTVLRRLNFPIPQTGECTKFTSYHKRNWVYEGLIFTSMNALCGRLTGVASCAACT